MRFHYVGFGSFGFGSASTEVVVGPTVHHARSPGKNLSTRSRRWWCQARSRLASRRCTVTLCRVDRRMASNWRTALSWSQGRVGQKPQTYEFYKSGACGFVPNSQRTHTTQHVLSKICTSVATDNKVPITHHTSVSVKQLHCSLHTQHHVVCGVRSNTTHVCPHMRFTPTRTVGKKVIQLHCIEIGIPPNTHVRPPGGASDKPSPTNINSMKIKRYLQQT